MDDLRRRMLLRKISEQSQPKVEEPQAPEPLVSDETLARIKAAKDAAAKAGQAGIQFSKQAARAAAEKAREAKESRRRVGRNLSAYKKVWIWGVAVLALSGGVAWWWIGRDRAPVLSPEANSPASIASPVPVPVISPEPITEPLMPAPVVEQPAALEPVAPIPMPVMPAGGGQLDAADIQRRAREERERERAAKSAAESAESTVQARPTPARTKPVQKAQVPATKPRVHKVEPVRAPVAKPVDDQQAKVEDWFKRLEESRSQ